MGFLNATIPQPGVKLDVSQFPDPFFGSRMVHFLLVTDDSSRTVCDEYKWCYEEKNAKGGREGIWCRSVSCCVWFMNANTDSMLTSKCSVNLRNTPRSTLLDKICTKLYNVGRYVFNFSLQPHLLIMSLLLSSFRSGAQPITSASAATSSTTAFAVAWKEYEDKSETDTKGGGREVGITA
jgi:hypothetical protein